MEEIRRIEEGIRSLEIQGARNVALAGLRALKIVALEGKARTTDELLDRLSHVAREVSLIRVTEPGLRNVLATVLSSSKEMKGLSIQDLRKHAAHKCPGNARCHNVLACEEQAGHGSPSAECVRQKTPRRRFHTIERTLVVTCE